MPVGTRSQSSSPTKQIPKEDQKTVKIPNVQAEPLKHFILPKDTSEQTRLISLNHPRTSTPERFLFCPEQGLFQFTRINAPSTDPHSVLFADLSADNHASIRGEGKGSGAISHGYISKGADFFVATPFDVAFILAGLVLPVSSSKAGRGLFQPLDDILEPHLQESAHLKYIYQHGRRFLEEGMSSICDTIESGDEHMYRPSIEKSLKMVMRKVTVALENGLPASFEDKFVKRKLEAPVLSVKREERMLSSSATGVADDEQDSASESFNSQSTTASSAPSLVFSEVSTICSTATVTLEALPNDLLELQKQSVVLNFILSSYLPYSVAERLKACFREKGGPVDFAPLDEHLKSIAELKATAAASRSLDDFSRKRGLEDDELADVRADKKRKQEEEDKKKRAGESKGVRDLKKVNVSGMKKMSAFFANKPIATDKS